MSAAAPSGHGLRGAHCVGACCVGGGADGCAVTTGPPTTEAGLQQERVQWLASCSGDEHAAAVADLLHHRTHDSAAEAAADATALARNPRTDFDDFARLVARHLDEWVAFGRRHVLDEPEYRIPVDAPGARARDWWLRLALIDIQSTFGVRGPWHDAWLLRRAFAVADPAQHAQLFRRVTGNDRRRGDAVADRTASSSHTAVRAQRVVGETSVRQQTLLVGWDAPWHRLRRDVPARTSREQTLRCAVWDAARADPDRAAVLAPVRRAVVSGFLTDGPERLFATSTTGCRCSPRTTCAPWSASRTRAPTWSRTTGSTTCPGRPSAFGTPDARPR